MGILFKLLTLTRYSSPAPTQTHSQQRYPYTASVIFLERAIFHCGSSFGISLVVPPNVNRRRGVWFFTTL